MRELYDIVLPAITVYFEAKTEGAMKQKRSPEKVFVYVICSAFILLIMAGSLDSVRGLLNPHVPPESCDSCHLKIPTEDEAGSGEYFLLKDTIDATCHVCHEYACCNVGSLHEKHRNHPSNIRNWDTEFAREPKKLPLHNGYITCNTCHLHRKNESGDYKMVRIVKIGNSKIDWTELCADCHVDY